MLRKILIPVLIHRTFKWNSQTCRLWSHSKSSLPIWSDVNQNHAEQVLVFWFCAIKHPNQDCHRRHKSSHVAIIETALSLLLRWAGMSSVESPTIIASSPRWCKPNSCWVRLFCGVLIHRTCKSSMPPVSNGVPSYKSCTSAVTAHISRFPSGLM